LFVPTLGALILLFVPARHESWIRWIALGTSLLAFVSRWCWWFRFSPTQTGFQFQEQFSWYAALNSIITWGGWHLPDDGDFNHAAYTLALLASYSITQRVKAYMILFLLLETGMLGVFLVLDLMLFFVFWEAGLVPMYFLIAQWGGANENYASLKFILYTMGGSLGLLLAIQLIGVVSGTYDIPQLLKIWPNLAANTTLVGLPLWHGKDIAFWAFVIAFCYQSTDLAVPYLATRRPYRGANSRFDDLWLGAVKLGAYGFCG